MKKCPACNGLGRERVLAPVTTWGRPPSLGACKECDGTGELAHVLLTAGEGGRPAKIRIETRDGRRYETPVAMPRVETWIDVEFPGRLGLVRCELMRRAEDGVLEYREAGPVKV